MDWTKIREFFDSLTLQKILPAVLILVIGFLVVKLLLKLFDRALQRSKLEKTMFTFVKTVMRLLLYVILLLVAASALGIDVTSLVAVLSVVSLAISLAVQNALANVVGCFTLLATHPFRVGDFVQVGNDSGTVEEISMSYTKIVSPDGRRIYIPNSDAATARICNYSVIGKRRIDLYFDAAYSDPIDKVKEALLQAARHPKIIDEEELLVAVDSYQGSSVRYLLRAWVTSNDYYEVKLAITEAVKRSFDDAGITIPYPQMDVHVSK